MSEIRFTVERATVGDVTDSALVLEGESPSSALTEAVWQAIWLDVNVTVGDVTMFAAAWEDPEHWAEDWAERLGCDFEDAPGAVAALLEAAMA